MTTSFPLSGITVIEIGHTVAAPYAGMILAELGANVIKIENPGDGDYTRGMPPFRQDHTSAVYQALNRGKRSVVVDMKNPSEARILRELIVEQADVVIHNLKFGAMEGLGFGSDDMCALKPALVYCNVGAFGHTGPLRERPGYDPLMQAYAGIMSIMGEDGRPPVRVGVSITDMAAGMWAVIGIQAACREAQVTGQGGVVDTSLFETALGWLTVQYSSFDASGVVPKREGSGLAMMAPYQAFESSDSHLMVAAGNDNNFIRLCRAINQPDLVGDPRFAANKNRVANRPALLEILEPVFKSDTTQRWLDRLEQAGVPCSPINSIDQVVGDPQAEALGIFQKSPDGTGTVLGLPLSFDAVRPPFRTTAPRLGEHTEQVLGALRSRLATPAED
ncbi:MAG: L-carnitine dehydratase/bile acid-inducible protein [Polaromonas sp.]|nr:L-carnitine dehydratase/bile acid-inducible protein [Polaromonas sp.]